MQRTIALLSLLFLGGAAVPAPPAQAADRGSPLEHDLRAHSRAATDHAAADEPTGDLRLRDVLALALARSPELGAYAARVRAAEAGELQAGLRPNPLLGLRAEDIGVSGQSSGIDRAEMTLELGQLIELGGKRAARLALAAHGRDAAAWDREIARIDVLARAANAFTRVLVAQEQVVLAEESVRLARDVVATVSMRVRAGSTSSVEQTKAEVAVASGRVELDEARHELEISRRELAASWGATTVRFVRALGSLEQLTPEPPLEQIEARIDESPNVARWATELLERQAAVDLERARAVPDVTASGGYRRLFDPDENTFVVGVTVPLPVLNRNQGAILAAEQRVAEARSDRATTRLRVLSALDEAHHVLITARARIATLDADVLPGARQAFATLNDGYREGRFDYIEVLDAQRTLIAARGQRVRALGEYRHAVVTLERLLGEPLDPEHAAVAGEEVGR